MSLQSIKQRFGIIGRSPLLDSALSTAERVANTDLTVLITGESGVGKEVFSKIIHGLSARKHNKFIAINTGAIPEGTINSELFGHEKGAFTGASSERKGYFETVDGGTIFLDEIGEMPLDTQAFLLRVLETGEFIRVGSSKPQKTNVRVIAATNVKLLDQVKKGKFREDLYYRLNTVPLKVPSLKERTEDISVLFRKFASDFADKYRTTPVRLDEKAEILVENYSWPGNIRELKNLVEQLSVLSDQKEITAEMVMDRFPDITKRNLPALADQGESIENDFKEREILYKLLFDMKHDLNDLKSLVYDLVSSNDLSVNDYKRLNQMTSNLESESSFREASQWERKPDIEISENSVPIIIEKNGNANYDNMEIVEESLSLEEMEKGMIAKALKKYKGKRKDAAHELGISERTLYRKIKQYELD